MGSIIQDAASPPASFWIDTEDWHTVGEPFRIVKTLPDGFLPASTTVAQRRFDVLASADHPLDLLRRSLCHEPRGHADMYGGFITPADDAGAHFGVLFWHKDGFSTACGHGTIALGYWAVAQGLVRAPEDGEVDVVVDVPSGRVATTMVMKGGKPVHAYFINVPSFQFGKALPVNVPSWAAELSVDVSFAGAVYATLDAGQMGLSVEPHNVDRFIAIGREVKAALGPRAHYGKYDCYGVIFYQEKGDDAGVVVRQRNVTVFADGQVDRSPWGSGTCARLAVLLQEGRVGKGGAKLAHRSIIASSFEADIVSDAESPVEGFRACVPRVKGTANLVGRMSFYIDLEDPIYPGFLLR